MFKLDVGKALIVKDHPMGREWEWPVAACQTANPLFSIAGKPGRDYCEDWTGSASLHFLEALGNSKILSVALP